ncbi:prolyl oligopeptidase family serine peptidase [Streptomyces malaysiensis]|uniref:prolyl oligopeptidase family serine peptidase n=1 Tax=Streptomyces malaysiensis TaxID=92644 RepID=UPI002B2A09E0|nr:prolyl oligopeptidase family serine peptidase [Streptomyces malaysiensis]
MVARRSLLRRSAALGLVLAGGAGLASCGRSETWTFQLRQGVRWHDGTEFTADDVLYSLRWMAKPGNGMNANVAAVDLDHLKKTGPYTVTIPLKQASPLFPYSRSMAWIIKNKTTDFTRPVGTGPFVFGSLARGERSTCRRNPAYWDTGKSYVNQLTLYSLQDDTTGTRELRPRRHRLSRRCRRQDRARRMGVSRRCHEWSMHYPHTPLLASRGYAVLHPSMRGSLGRGEKFIRDGLHDMGGADAADVVAGIDALAATGRVDPARVGVTGNSYGGFMAAWLVATTKRFAAAVARSPVTDWVSQHYTSNIPGFDRMCLTGHPLDPQLIYQDEGHGVRGSAAVVDQCARMIGFLDEHLAAGGAQ